MINHKAIKAIHGITSLEDLKNLPYVPAETFFGELYLDGNEIYSEKVGDHKVIFYQNELPFYPHLILKYKEFYDVWEATVFQEDTLIFDLENFKVLHDRDLTFLASDLDDPDGEYVEFWNQESFEKNFDDLSGLLAYLKGFFGENGFNKHLLKHSNIKDIFLKSTNDFYSKRKQEAA